MGPPRHGKTDSRKSKTKKKHRQPVTSSQDGTSSTTATPYKAPKEAPPAAKPKQVAQQVSHSSQPALSYRDVLVRGVRVSICSVCNVLTASGGCGCPVPAASAHVDVPANLALQTTNVQRRVASRKRAPKRVAHDRGSGASQTRSLSLSTGGEREGLTASQPPVPSGSSRGAVEGAGGTTDSSSPPQPANAQERAELAGAEDVDFNGSHDSEEEASDVSAGEVQSDVLEDDSAEHDEELGGSTSDGGGSSHGGGYASRSPSPTNDPAGGSTDSESLPAAGGRAGARNPGVIQRTRAETVSRLIETMVTAQPLT